MSKNAVYIIICTVFFLGSTNVYAQQVPDTIGDIDAPVDTAEFYRKLYKYSKDKKAVYFIYKTLFNPPEPGKIVKQTPKGPAVTARKYRNKIIRNIQIVSLDPFGTNVNDTTKQARNFAQRSGNLLHVESKNQTIRNYLLFREGERIDPLKLDESERLLRATSFIRDARITVQAVPGTKDSFDIVVVSQDYWSIRFNIDATTSRVRYRITEKNMVGWGHEFDNRITDRLKESQPLILDGRYTIPTIGNTYISPSLYYGTEPDNNAQGLEIKRPFYSPLTKWAGGLEFLSLSQSDSIRWTDDTTYGYSFRSIVADAWVGYSIALRSGETDEERSTRLIGATRFARGRYPSLQVKEAPLQEHFSRSDFYLASLSLSSRKYLKERYILKFGEIEDVPDGNKLTLTVGLENRNTGIQYYVGIDGAIGRYFPKIGDIYFGAGYGTFIKGHDLFATTVSTNIIYFSPLAQLGKWRLRQFGNFNFVYGIDRKPTELVNLNADNGIPGYKDDLPVGTSRMVLASQTVFYTPYVFLGFRFAPIVLLGVGMIGKYNQSVLNSRLYQMYGIGLLMKNELLVLNTFQVTIAIYPVLPGGGSDIRMNPVKLTESRFADFDITRPDVLLFE